MRINRIQKLGTGKQSVIIEEMDIRQNVTNERTYYNWTANTNKGSFSNLYTDDQLNDNTNRTGLDILSEQLSALADQIGLPESVDDSDVIIQEAIGKEVIVNAKVNDNGYLSVYFNNTGQVIEAFGESDDDTVA